MAVGVGVWDCLSVNAQAVLNGRQSRLATTEAPTSSTEDAIESIDNVDDDAHDSVTRIDFLTPDPNLTIPFEFATGPSEDICIPWEKVSWKARARLFHKRQVENHLV